jgi:predicted nuclease of predicted toxin-antitoxin system
MRLLADLHIAPRTIEFLRTLGHDVRRVTDLLPATATDEAIVECAMQERRTILTQDLDFTSIIALSGRATPSLVSLRLGSVTIESVNAALQRILPALEHEIELGALITVEDHRIRLRRLPIDIQGTPSI